MTSLVLVSAQILTPLAAEFELIILNSFVNYFVYRAVEQVNFQLLNCETSEKTFLKIIT